MACKSQQKAICCQLEAVLFFPCLSNGTIAALTVADLHRWMRKRQTCMRLCFLHKQLWWKPILPAGLELFFIEGGGGPQWGAPSAFFAFPNSVEASKAGKMMLAQPCLGEALPGGRAAAAAAGSILEVCRSCMLLCLTACKSS